MFLGKNKLFRTLLFPLEGFKQNPSLCPKRKPNCTVKTHAILFSAGGTLALPDNRYVDRQRGLHVIFLFQQRRPVLVYVLLNVIGYINGSQTYVVIPGSEEAGETQDEDRGTEDGQTEIMEHHGTVLHHVTTRQREQLERYTL